jgi:ribosomal protein S11
MADELVQEKIDSEVPVTEQAAEQPEATAAKPARRRKVRRSVPSGRVCVLATFNNTIITITDSSGNVIASASAGASGFRGSKKGTAYATGVPHGGTRPRKARRT